MKKKNFIIIVLVVSIIICSLLFGLIIFFNQSMKAVVIKTHENSLMVMDIKDNSPYYIGIPSNVNAQFKPGQEVLIFYRYGTIIEESYPANIRSDFVKSIKVLKEKSNINIPDILLDIANGNI